MTRRSTIVDIAEKSGASGPMTFVIVRQEIFVGGEVALNEEHDIVYRGVAGAASPPNPSVPLPGEEAEFRRTVAPGAVELFLYSALTYNGHRIHYDRDYATRVELYPGLVVHGPLIATLLIDNLLRWKPGVALARFAYRARSPLFEDGPFDLCARPIPNGARLWAQGAGAPIAMEGEAGF